MFRVNNLIIIGGPSCSGKSTLINRIRQGGCSYIRKHFGISDPSSWIYLEARELPHIRQPIVERLVVHYDLYAQYSQENGFKHLDQLLTHSDQIIVLTIYVSPEKLVKHSNSRIFVLSQDLICSNKRLSHYSKILQKIHYLWIKRKAYKRGISELLYERWFRYLSRSPLTSHWLLDIKTSNIMQSVDIWYLSCREMLGRRASP